MQLRLVLASNSPRRRQLLAMTGWSFSVIPAEIDESIHPEEDPRQYVQRMAESKAKIVSDQVHADCLVIGADTIVVDEDGTGKEVILGKPVDAKDAFNILNHLRGHEHKVYTALAVVRALDGKVLSTLDTTRVCMRDYKQEEIAAYIETGDPFDKAGAYAIQHEAFHPVENLEGCYATVVGLPLCLVVRILMDFDVQPLTDITRDCRRDLSSPCLVYQQVVNEEL